MKTLLGSFLLLFTICSLHAQDDGKIIQKTDLILPDSVRTRIKARLDGQAADKILELRFSKITYLSDGLKVIAYLVEPKEEGKYPCIISNRGGNRDFGQWSPLSIALFLGSMASWDYVVIASQYRGNDAEYGATWQVD